MRRARKVAADGVEATERARDVIRENERLGDRHLGVGDRDLRTMLVVEIARAAEVVEPTADVASRTAHQPTVEQQPRLPDRFAASAKGAQRGPGAGCVGVRLLGVEQQSEAEHLGPRTLERIEVGGRPVDLSERLSHRAVQGESTRERETCTGLGVPRAVLLGQPDGRVAPET